MGHGFHCRELKISTSQWLIWSILVNLNYYLANVNEWNCGSCHSCHFFHSNLNWYVVVVTVASESLRSIHWGIPLPLDPNVEGGPLTLGNWQLGHGWKMMNMSDRMMMNNDEKCWIMTNNDESGTVTNPQTRETSMNIDLWPGHI